MSIKADIAVLSEEAGVPDLWDDPASAQIVTSKLSHRQSELERLNKIRTRIEDLEVLVELAEMENDDETLAEADKEVNLHSEGPRRSWRSSPCSMVNSTHVVPS